MLSCRVPRLLSENSPSGEHLRGLISPAPNRVVYELQIGTIVQLVPDPPVVQKALPRCREALYCPDWPAARIDRAESGPTNLSIADAVSRFPTVSRRQECSAQGNASAVEH